MDQGVIRRKLAGVLASPVEGGAERALPLALARAARDLCGLVLEVTEVRGERISLTELLELVPERGMIALLSGPGEAVGVMMLEAEVLAGLIEAQTLGRVSSQPVVPRKPTRTDAAMAEDFIDTAIEGLTEALLADEDLTWIDGFRYTSFLDDPRPLGLMLEDAGYKVLRAQCTLGAGARHGTLILALPAEGHGRRPHRPAQIAGEDAAASMVFSAALGAQVMAADAEVQAVLCRVTLPLAAVIGLQPGAVLPLTGAGLDRIGLEGIDGNRVGGGRLGQHRGMRAVRLGAAAAPVHPAAASSVSQSAPPAAGPTTALPLAASG